MRSVEHELRRFIIDNFLYGRSVDFSNDDSFLEMGLIDSTGILELVSFLEKQYDITVEDVELVPENLDSIAQLASFIDRKTQATLQDVTTPSGLSLSRRAE